LGPDPAGFGHAPLAGSRERAAAEKAAADAIAAVPELGSAIRIRVRAADAAVVAKALAKHGAEGVRIDLGTDSLFLVANRKDLSFAEHPWFGQGLRAPPHVGAG